MASINKRGKGYQIKWREPDRLGGWRQRSRSAPDKRTADQIKREVERAVALGQPWRPATVRQGAGLEQALKGYLAEMAAAKQPRTVARHAQNLDVFLRWLRGNVGDIPTLEDLSKRRLMAYYDALATGGRHGRSRNLDTRRRMVQDVFQAWEWLDNQDEYEETVPRPRRFDMRRQPQSPTLAPTWAEMAACVGATQGWHRRVGLVLYYTGLRGGQVMQLRWSDFDLDHASGPLLTIRGELGKTKHERMGRVVPVSAHLVEELRTWERIEDWLIVSPRKRGGARERMFRARDMGRAWERAGVPQAFWKQRPDHAFRKGLISGLKREGADDEAVEQLVGHKQVGQRATYIDPDALPMREAVRLIPRVWDVPLATAGPLRAAGR